MTRRSMAGGDGCPTCAQVATPASAAHNASAVAAPHTGGFSTRKNGAVIQKRFNNIAKEIEDFLAKY